MQIARGDSREGPEGVMAPLNFCLAPGLAPQFKQAYLAYDKGSQTAAFRTLAGGSLNLLKKIEKLYGKSKNDLMRRLFFFGENIMVLGRE